MRIRSRLFAILFVAATLFPPSLFAQVAISSDTPLYFCIGVHIEPLGAQPSALVGSDVQRMPPRSGLDYNRSSLFLRHVADLQALAAVVEKHGGRMTVQAQTPFTSICVKTGERILAGFEKRGHEIALHFHEDAHLGRGSERLPVGTWTAVMKEEIEWIKKAGATRIRYWSGGNLYPGVLDAATAAGLEIQSDHKNPRRQRSDERLLTLTPWRPAGGPREDDVADFARHDPNGKIIFLPDGVLDRVDAISMRRSETFGGDQKYFDYLARALRESVKAARRDRINVFHITVHAGEFRGGPNAEKPFGVIDRWLTDAVDPLVKTDKVKWATFSEMADAFRAWEKKNPGTDPRATPGATPPAAGVPVPSSAERPQGGTSTAFSRRDLDVVNPTSGAKLWATAIHPNDASTQKKYPAVVFVPGGLGFGSQMLRTPVPGEYVRAGFVLGLFDPDGRRQSQGWENWNGKVHQDGLRALLKAVAALPFVDKDNIGVVSSSLGLAMAAGTLGRYPNDPPVKYFIDIEGPTDRFYITKNDDPGFSRILGGHSTQDADWWAEREAVRTIQNIVCPYLRIQYELDHVQGPDKGHATDIINAATHTKYGGKGKSPWTRINGPENDPNRTYTKDNPPKWLSGRQGRGRTDDTLRWIREMAGVQKTALSSSSLKSSPPTFFAVHCEAHSANPVMWDALCRFVAMADRYEAKLTLMFNPQWAEFIVPDRERFERVKSWQKNGHEIAVHYHNIIHGNWNGHTNRKDERYTRDSRYRGTVSEMMTPLQKLAAPDTMLTMCMGPDTRWDSLNEVEIDEPDYPDGILYDVDGMDVGLAPLMKTKFKGHDLFHLKHHFFAAGQREEHLDRIKEEFGRAKPGEVLGVVTHEADFARSPEFIEKWFQFCRENKTSIRTVRNIVKTHPQDQVIEVPYVRQDNGSAQQAATPQRGVFLKVRKFQELLKAAKEKNANTSAAENLDQQSRRAARAGNMAEAEQLLDRAIEALGQEKPTITDKRGCITFAVNTHDWPHLEESAATVLRLIGIFEKNKVRGDFYLTPQMVEHYEQKRPDVIQRLRQSGMCISYHVRPPHPTYTGFDRHLHNLDDTTLAKMLRDYETYRLDPATGELQRDKPGGYSYVAKVLGRAPVVVSPQCRDPRIRDAALKVYAELGAKMVVAYHESGTKPEQPFEWTQGLLVRPSDFSITRWGAGGRQETFWWNMLDTPRAADFNPTERLKSQLAAWKGARAPFITVLIHENDFSRSGGTGWGGIYLDGEGRNSRPKQPPYDLNAPDPSHPRSADARERIWSAYEAMVAHAAANLRVVTSEEIVAMAKP